MGIEITLATTKADAKRILKAFKSGALKGLGVVTVIPPAKPKSKKRKVTKSKSKKSKRKE